MYSMNRSRPREPRLSIVIPARNEARNLEVILPELPPVYEVILVDGHSVDGTIDAARRVMPDIKVCQQTRRGKGNALACGFEAATGDIVIMFDADGSADPREIPMFVSALVAGADFAKGSRFLNEGSSEDITPLRSAGNRGLNVIANRITRSRYSDLCYGYNAFWIDVLNDLQLPATSLAAGNDVMVWGDGFEIETVINCRIAFAGLIVTEIPSVERRRIHGESNLNAISDGYRVFKTILAEKKRAGLIARNPMAGAAPIIGAAPVADVSAIVDGLPELA